MTTTTTTAEVLASARAALDSHEALMATVRASQINRKQLVRGLPSPPDQLLSLPPIPQRSPSPDSTPPSSPKLNPHLAKQLDQLKRNDLSPAKLARVAKYQNYIPEEETIRNDYSQQYVDSGEWPQNWVLGAELERRFEEYPKQQKLLALKRAAVDAYASRPSFLPIAQLSSLHPCKFDVILIDPQSTEVTWEQLLELPIPALSADPSFIFLWVGHGSSDGLERGRELLAKWGFRRCEDIVWVKTNKTTNREPGTDPPPIGGLLTRTTEHCLMGIRGTVRRSTDGWFVHCNIDTDVIIWEGDPADPLRKPPEMYSLIENFCLGTRRLEIFGRASSLRRGWVTLGSIDNPQVELERLDCTAWDREWWETEIRMHGGGKSVVPTSVEIDGLRPKSPVRNSDRANGNNNNPGGANAMGGMGAIPMQNAPMRLVPGPGNMQMGMQMQPQGMMGGMGGMGGVGVMNPAFAGVPMPQAAFGFDGPQQMPMGGMVGMGMSPMNGGVGVPMNAMGVAGMAMAKPNPIQVNPPIRLGGGPMHGMGMGVNVNMGGSPGMSAGLQNLGGIGMGGMGMNMGMGMGMGGSPGMMQPAMGMGITPNPAMGMNNMGRNMPMLGMQQGMQQGMGMGMPMNANMAMNMGMMGAGAGMMDQGMQMQGMGGGPMRFNPQQQNQQQQGRPTGNQGY